MRPTQRGMKHLLLISLTLIGYSSFSFQKNDSTLFFNSKKQGIYAEGIAGGILVIGHTYTFYSQKRLNLNTTAGIGINTTYYNPYTAFYIPLGIETNYLIKNHLHLSTGVNNFIYVNYWANFSTSGKNCSGFWSCPPDFDPIIIMPHIGGKFDYKWISIEPRVYFSFHAWWDKICPLPALRLKLKF